MLYSNLIYLTSSLKIVSLSLNLNSLISLLFKIILDKFLKLSLTWSKTSNFFGSDIKLYTFAIKLNAYWLYINPASESSLAIIK